VCVWRLSPYQSSNSHRQNYMLNKYGVVSCLWTDPVLHCESNQATELPDQQRLQHPSATIQPTHSLSQKMIDSEKLVTHWLLRTHNAMQCNAALQTKKQLWRNWHHQVPKVMGVWVWNGLHLPLQTWFVDGLCPYHWKTGFPFFTC